MRAAALLAVVIVGAQCSTALADDTPGVVTGAGSHSCAEYGTQYKANPKIVEALYDSWTQGFISGLNISAASQHEPMRNISVVTPRVPHSAALRQATAGGLC
jgi:hypothetical protein